VHALRISFTSHLTCLSLSYLGSFFLNVVICRWICQMETSMQLYKPLTSHDVRNDWAMKETTFFLPICLIVWLLLHSHIHVNCHECLQFNHSQILPFPPPLVFSLVSKGSVAYRFVSMIIFRNRVKMPK
jgi:hypothetical protein